MTRVSATRVEAGEAGGFDVHSIVASKAGPRIVVLGGVHGDETEGALAAGRLVASPPALVRGQLDVVPVTHEAAFATDSRTSPIDGVNLARVFPGDPNGGPTARLAHHLYDSVLADADLLIDLHTSGSHYDMPFLAGYRGEPGGGVTDRARAAHAFGADFVWRHPGRSEGRTVSVVENAIYAECPGGGSTDLAMVDAYHRGVLNVLAEFHFTDSEVAVRKRPAILVTGGGNLDRDMISIAHDGVFLTPLARGDTVDTGQMIGTVIDNLGRQLATIHAGTAGRVMALKRRSKVSKGDLVVCIAAEDDASPL